MNTNTFLFSIMALSIFIDLPVMNADRMVREKFKEIISFKVSLSPKVFHLQLHQLKETVWKNNWKEILVSVLTLKKIVKRNLGASFSKKICFCNFLSVDFQEKEKTINSLYRFAFHIN